ncbi:MAG: GAF domain-containing protein [Candidatus Methanomethylophilaceae archaeon]
MSSPIQVLFISDDLAHAQELAREVSRMDGKVQFRFSPRVTEALHEMDGNKNSRDDVILIDCHVLRDDPTAGETLCRHIGQECPCIAVISSEDLPLMTLIMEQDVDLYLNKSRPLPDLAKLLLQRIHALRDLQQAESIRQRTEMRLQALVELAQTRGTTFSEVADYVLRKIVELTNSEMGYMAFLEDEGRTLRMHAWSEEGMSRCRVPQKPYLYSMDKVGIWGEPIRQGVPVVLNDFQAPHPLKRGTPEGHVHIDSYMAVPVRLDGEIVGTAGVANKRTPYDDTDVSQIQLLTEGMVSIQRGIGLRREILEAQAKYQALLDSLPFTVAVLDSESRILSINRTPPGSDRPANEIEGRMLSEMENEAGMGFTRIFRAACEAGSAVREEALLQGMDGQMIHLDVSISPVRMPGVGASLYIATINDVTEIRRALLNLHKTREKQQLMESMTYHDIFNQVQVMKGYLELMSAKEGRDRSDLRLFASVEKAADSIMEQMKIIRDYHALGLSDPEWLDLDHELQRGLEGSGLSSDKMHTRCQGRMILADNSFFKVFHNLFQNTARHGGDVKEVQVSCEELSDGGLRIIYQDDGVGIAAEDKERIFQRGFGRNTGLGMFLVREILHISGFEIRETGTRGARFEIDVPANLHRLV